jgi:hypothetical protein
MKPEIRKIVTKSALFFGVLAVSAAETAFSVKPQTLRKQAQFCMQSLSPHKQTD